MADKKIVEGVGSVLVIEYELHGVDFMDEGRHTRRTVSDGSEQSVIVRTAALSGRGRKIPRFRVSVQKVPYRKRVKRACGGLRGSERRGEESEQLPYGNRGLSQRVSAPTQALSFCIKKTRKNNERLYIIPLEIIIHK